MSSVALRGLTKRFGSAVALDDVSLEIAHGQLVCLLGPSGCGKTTALRLVAGFIEPTAGEIAIGDRVVSSPKRTLPPERRNVSMVFQSYALWPHMTVAENVGLRAHAAQDRPRHHPPGRSTPSWPRPSCRTLAARYPGELSGGQQQRVALARALIVEPETLLLDEPLSNLDANLREEMRFEVRRLHDEYRYTTVYVTHDQSEAMTTADLIAVMNHGRIEQLGTPEDIYERPRSEFVARFIGSSNVVTGKVLDGSRISLAGIVLRGNGGTFVTGGDGAISIRQHDIVLTTAEPQGSAENVFPATVIRNVFLGGSRDYMVEIADGTQLRVLTPATDNIAQGSRVQIRLPVERCRILVE